MPPPRSVSNPTLHCPSASTNMLVEIMLAVYIRVTEGCSECRLLVVSTVDTLPCTRVTEYVCESGLLVVSSETSARWLTLFSM